MSKIFYYCVCYFCEVICGFVIEIESDEGGVLWICLIKGDLQDSFSCGYVCFKVVVLQDIQDDFDCLCQLLCWVGSEWQLIGWDEVFVLVVSCFGEICECYGNDVVVVYQGNLSVYNYGLMIYSNYFFGLLKMCNCFFVIFVDQLLYYLVSQQMYGYGLLILIFDIDYIDFMLVFGGNLLVFNGSIMIVLDVEKCLKVLKVCGGWLVVVDFWCSEIVVIVDWYLFICFGQDVVLLFGIFNILFEENFGCFMLLLVDGLEWVCEVVVVFDVEFMSVCCGVLVESIC